MTSAAQLREAGTAFLDEPVLAAGIFSAGSAIAASIAGAAGGATVGGIAAEVAKEEFTESAVESVAGEVAGAVAGGALTGATAYAGMHAAREVAAAAEGLTPVLIVMVTERRYVIGDWQGNAASGTGPTRVLAEFDRARTSLSFDTLGVNRFVTFDDGAKSVKVSGALGMLSSGKEGKRAVLEALGHPNA
ncbi:MAG: hypothetical protein RL134_481 [Actinomycetota bacterium]|jgi:hypothetical protein